MKTSGSYHANFAVETLAADLGVTVIVLKAMLEDALNLLNHHSASTPNLALHMAFARHGYKIDGQVLLAKLSTFRWLFSGVLGDVEAGPTTSQPAASQMRPNPYRGLESSQPGRGGLPVQYTSDAMSWKSNHQNPRLMSPPRPKASPHSPRGRYQNPRIMTKQEPVQSSLQPHGSLAQSMPHDQYNQRQKQPSWYQQQLGGDIVGFDDSGSDLLYRFGGME